jgi:hypothetical protein
MLLPELIEKLHGMNIRNYTELKFYHYAEVLL